MVLLLCSTLGFSQTNEQIVEQIQKEANENSQLEQLAHELVDVIGPRLVGTPQLEKAHDWAVRTYKKWGIEAKNEAWGKWRGWERGITHIDLLEPRVVSLNGMQLAWSPSTGPKGITANLVTLPMVSNSMEFTNWLPHVKGKLVMVSMEQPTGRPDYNWEEFATEESYAKMKAERQAKEEAWQQNFRIMGHDSRSINAVLEKAGAVGIVQSRWSEGFGANKIFSANTKKIPVVDLSLEDYGLLYRMVSHGKNPKIRIVAESKELGVVPTFNTIATIPGNELPDEYVILSAHLDTWDGATGATDNGTGTIIMMEAARILKKVYPNPKRTILVGHWSSEEQGLNGSRAFVEDHPEIVANVQALFNQDNGTGRVVNLSGQGFLHSYDWELDTTGKALEGIMQGPMVVTQWINNHYYFSTVDNDTYGGGTKITHNITGKFGVVQGNGGDLKMGLPLQSLFRSDDAMYHQPLRLSVMIQAPTARVSEILLGNSNLKTLLDNEWIYLMVMDPEQQNEVFRYEKSIKWVSISTKKESETAQEKEIKELILAELAL